MAEPYGTIAKYRNILAIKKHNAIIQPWASTMALDVAAVFWATWKGIESDCLRETRSSKQKNPVIPVT